MRRVAPPLARIAPAMQARAARWELEAALGPDVARWPWSRRLSLWCDALVLLEESTT